MSIPDLIAAVSERLTPTERRIAAAVLADPTLLAFGTVSDLADLVGTSRPSIVRFGTKLGFEGYADLQSHVQTSMSAQLSRPSQRIRHQEDSLEPSRQALTEALASAFEAIAGKRLAQLVAPIAKAKSVWILSGETSRAGAHALFSGLSIVRPNVRLIDDHDSAGALSGAAPGDTAVVLDFPRYRRHVINAATALSEHGIKLVAITDGPLSPLAGLTKTWCPLKIPAIGPFDSSVPTVALAELLVAGVAAKLHKQASQRIDRTEALWHATDTFLD